MEPNQYFVVSFNVKTNFSVKTNDSKLRDQPPLHHPKEKDPDRVSNFKNTLTPQKD